MEPEHNDTAIDSDEPTHSHAHGYSNSVCRPADGFGNQQNLATPLGSAWLGIVFAGGLYPLIVLTIGAIVAVLFDGQRIFTPGWFPDALFFLFAVYMAGLFYAIAGSIPAYCLLQFCRFFTHWVLTERGACGVYGGLTGFLCMTGGGLYFLNSPILPEEIPVVFLSLVAGAVALGHLGGIHRCYLKRRSKDWFKAPFFDPNQRISLKFFMGLTVTVGIFVACCKAAGESGLSIGIAWAMYGLLQIFLLFVEHAWRARISGMPFCPVEER